MMSLLFNKLKLYKYPPKNQDLCDPRVPSKGPLAGQGAAMDALRATPSGQSLVGETVLYIVWKDLGRSGWAKVVI